MSGIQAIDHVDNRETARHEHVTARSERRGRHKTRYVSASRLPADLIAAEEDSDLERAPYQLSRDTVPVPFQRWQRPVTGWGTSCDSD